MLSHPETLMLFALHDERGTVRSSAFIGLDEVLYAAVLSELMLRGLIRVRSDGTCRIEEDIPDCDSVLLLLAHKALREGRARTVEACLDALESRLGSVRSRVQGALAAKGVLKPVEIDRVNLADSTAQEMADSGPEAEMLAHVRAGIAAGDGVDRRIGTLVGLVHVLGLWEALLDRSERKAASALGDWVLERDAICRAAQVAVSKAEGTWEG